MGSCIETPGSLLRLAVLAAYGCHVVWVSVEQNRTHLLQYGKQAND